MESPTTSYNPRELSCPGAPRKPQRPPYLSPSSTQAIASLLRDLSFDDKSQALHHMPRHVFEGIFLLYCDWKQQRGCSDFEDLLSIVPSLEAQLYMQAVKVLGRVTWDSWAQQVVSLNTDTTSRHNLSDELFSSVHQSARKTLAFD